MDTLFLIGRILYGGFFLYSGINHFRHLEMMSGYSKMKGVPMPSASVALSGALIILGGLSVLLGVYPHAGIVLIAAFLIPVSFMMHSFWNIPDPQMKGMEKVNFTKNMALLGTAFMLAVIPTPWPFSL